MTQTGDRHVGLLVYCWGLDEQTRLLVGGLAPLVAELRERDLKRFWFDRFDARGPHLFALFTVPGERFAVTAELVEGRVAQYLAEHPSLTELSLDELVARHRACRGTALCAVDAEAGFAANNTLRVCEQAAEGYPFSLGRGLAEPARLFALLDGLTAWALARLAGQPAGAPPIALAISWLAALFNLLPARLVEPQAYWQFHTATLVGRSAATADGEELACRLTQAVGARNDAVLTPLWRRARSAPPVWPPLSRLIDLVAGADEARGPERYRLLREIVHLTMQQLGIPTRLEKVLLLFCWRESLQAVARVSRPPHHGGHAAGPRG